VVSLFSGACGFSYGCSNAGLTSIVGAEIDTDACQTFEMNLGSTCHQIDLAAIEPTVLKKMAGPANPFIVIGGPPCQGFSTAGPRNATDPRNRLIFNYLSIVEELAPSWFIFENVEGLLTSGNGQDLTCLIRQFVALGYCVRVQKVNFAAYGVPQTRKRVLIIGNRMRVNFTFPAELFSYDSGKAKKVSGLPSAPTLDNALDGLGRPSANRLEMARYESSEPLGAYDRLMRCGNEADGVTQYYLSSTYREKKQIEMLLPGQTMKDLPFELQHSSFERRANRRVSDGTPTEKRGGAPSGIKRLHGNLQSLTITGAATREFIHPREHRPLTIRECARIQTFPDEYQWAGNSASATQQIGNAVPPAAATILAQHIQYLDGRFGSGMQHSEDVGSPSLLGYLLTESSGMSPALKKTEALLAGLQQRSFSFD